MATFIDEKKYKDCVAKTFGNKKTLDWGGRRIPPREAINLILSITKNSKGKYGPEDLAVVWAIETNFYTRPLNKGNKRGANIVSVDIGPAQINYPTWLGPGTRDSLRKTILGTNLKDGQRFNGEPKANLNFAWKYILPKLGGPIGYNPLSKKRATAVKILMPQLKSLFSCM